ncbi:Inactive TPR repeat-containing thioredoxin TTL3 [Acorus gramineus]|uniref:Inactive TPR repeat-containing thioredoxin TTL3 n=1 Tax=Acorus gramineus TaxID=55184 RepID=A0AAV9BVR9_ACOGR|nr:Inactive TPR repeat-containing thioredoxin TTL3 [Acorus gramineus]
MSTEPEKKPSGCGVLIMYTGLFRRTRRSTSSSALSTQTPSENSKRRRSGSDESSLIVTATTTSATVAKPNAHHPHHPHHHHHPIVPAAPPARKQAHAPPAHAAHMMRMESAITRELDHAIYDHQRSKASGSLVRASSSNFNVFGHLGNIRAGNSNPAPPPMTTTAREPREARKPNASPPPPPTKEPVLCRALSRRLDPEELKTMGNEEYKKGRFAEALALYDRAISLDPNRASYRSNKAAALMGLGRLLEAVEECKEAVRIEPSYGRAHHRLATLYLRLGEAEKAIKHFKMAGDESDPNDVMRAQAVQSHINRCREARRLREWHTVLKEAESAISAGSDSAPQVLAPQAEALLKLQRHQDAEAALAGTPIFDLEASMRFFEPASYAHFLMIRAQVDMAAGRFDEAVAGAQRAGRADPNNRDAGAVLRLARAVAAARASGNELFKAGKFGEACAAYGEGLQQEPVNAVLLCNRAACYSKLGQHKRAVEDCTAALNVRPAYAKARLRRADCNAKMKRWEAAVQDYEALVKAAPGDEEVARSLAEARAQLKKQRQYDQVDDDDEDA